MTPKEAYEAISDLTLGDCYWQHRLNDPIPSIGLDGEFTAVTLRQIADILDKVQKCNNISPSIT